MLTLPAFKPDPELDRSLGRRIQASIAAGSLDYDARDQLVSRHLRLAVMLAAHGHTGDSDVLDDRIQAAAIGMTRAAEMWDPTRGIPFENYAAQRARASIQQEECRALRGPTMMSKSAALARGVPKLLEAILGAGDDPTAVRTGAQLREAAARHGIELSPKASPSMLHTLHARRTMRVVGLDERPDDGHRLAETLGAPVEQDNWEHEREVYARVLAEMRAEGGSVAKRAEVLTLLAEPNDDGSERVLEDVSQILGVSRERVRQLKIAAIAEVQRRVAAQQAARVGGSNTTPARDDA